MAVFDCSIYHKFRNTLVYKKGHHARLSQRLLRPKKHLLLKMRNWRQMICKLHVLLRAADAHMNQRASDCSKVDQVRSPPF